MIFRFGAFGTPERVDSSVESTFNLHERTQRGPFGGRFEGGLIGGLTYRGRCYKC